MLDDAGLPNCKITASNALDEYLIRDLIMQGAAIDTFGVGERMITAASEPVFGGVYKLAAVEDRGRERYIPKIKISENVGKITNPHFKKVYRLLRQRPAWRSPTMICVHDEVIDTDKAADNLRPSSRSGRRKTLTEFTARRAVRCRCSRHGELVYELPTLKEIQRTLRGRVATPCGTRSSASRTRTTTTSTCLRSSGESRISSSARTRSTDGFPGIINV